MNRIFAFFAGLLIAVSSAYAAKVPDETALGGAPASDDLIRMVDVSDHTQSAQGTTKKMTVAELFSGAQTIIANPVDGSGPAFVTEYLIRNNAGAGIGSVSGGLGTSALALFSNNTMVAEADNRGLYVGRDMVLGLSSSAFAGASAPDVGFGRAAAHLPEINDGTKGGYAGVALKLGGQAVSDLPTCDATATGARATVNDATSATFHADPVGGGSTVVPVYCDGSNWKIGG